MNFHPKCLKLKILLKSLFLIIFLFFQILVCVVNIYLLWVCLLVEYKVLLKIDLHLELLFRDPFVEFVRRRWSLEERHLLILSFCDELDLDYESLSEREILLYRDATTPSLIKKATLLILEQRENPLYQIYNFFL